MLLLRARCALLSRLTLSSGTREPRIIAGGVPPPATTLPEPEGGAPSRTHPKGDRGPPPPPQQGRRIRAASAGEARERIAAPTGRRRRVRARRGRRGTRAARGRRFPARAARRRGFGPRWAAAPGFAARWGCAGRGERASSSEREGAWRLPAGPAVESTPVRHRAGIARPIRSRRAPRHAAAPHRSHADAAALPPGAAALEVVGGEGVLGPDLPDVHREPAVGQPPHASLRARRASCGGHAGGGRGGGERCAHPALCGKTGIGPDQARTRPGRCYRTGLLGRLSGAAGRPLDEDRFGGRPRKNGCA